MQQAIEVRRGEPGGMGVGNLREREAAAKEASYCSCSAGVAGSLSSWWRRRKEGGGRAWGGQGAAAGGRASPGGRGRETAMGRGGGRREGRRRDGGGTGRGMVGGGEDMEAKEVKVGNLEEDRMSLDKGPT